MNDIYTRIEDFLDNALTDAERDAFEAEVRADPALADALALAREARERFARQWKQEASEAELGKTLKTLGKQHFGNEVLTATPTRRIWRWAAAAAAAVALIIWLVWPPKAENLYDRYRKFPEAGFALKNGAPAAQALDAAARSFNTKDYQSALDALNIHLQTNPGDLEALFFAGLCRLELGQFAGAESAFQQILSANNAWSEEARWYLALTYLSSKRLEKCSEILRQIPPGGAHYAEAQMLLKKL